MNEFDLKAAGWDLNPMHRDRSEAIVREMGKNIPLNGNMKAMEYGAGTGIASFLLHDQLKYITLMDNSAEMVRIMKEKIKASKVKNLDVLNFDLEHNDYAGGKFDLIFTQMVLHHVANIESITGKFAGLLNPGGYLAIADLYEEDGSFHGEGFTGHNGFDPDKLSETLRKLHFTDVSYETCFVIEKRISESETKKYEVFLITARHI